MQTTSVQLKRLSQGGWVLAREGGHAMIVALMLLLLIATLTSVAMLRTTTIGSNSARASDYAEAERTADGLMEYAFGIWKQAAWNKGGVLTASDCVALVTAIGTPTVAGLTYDTAQNYGPIRIVPADPYGTPTPGADPIPAFSYLQDYPGWRGYNYDYLASVKLIQNSGPGKRPSAGSKRLFEYIIVPLFQAMYFYEDDLEIYRPAPMIVGGLVHSNSRLLLSGSADTSGAELTFNGNVSYAGGTSTVAGYTYSEPPIGGPKWAFGYGMPPTASQLATAVSKMEQATFSGGGVSTQLNNVERFEPLGSKAAALINATDTNPNNDSFRELIEPPVASFPDPDGISKRRIYNKAGIIITVNSPTITSTNRATAISVTTQNGTTLSSAQITAIQGALSKTTMYDMREGKNVDTVNVDMTLLTPQLNSATGFNGALYIQDVTPVATGDVEPKTVRLQKGGTLPNTGLTLGSQNPVYIQGDYNTGTTYNSSGVPNSTLVPANSTGNPNNTDSPVVAGYQRKPAAVLADTVMFLSNSWNDANSSNTTLSNRTASNTTYNVAMMSGYIPSGYDPDGSGPIAPYGYSGGANNFPRFLEAWSGKTVTYYGSMIEMFKSKTFTGAWNTGNIYSAPNRRWNYDPMFDSTPPPGNIDVVVIGRGKWARY